ncbi:WD40 repeat protein [Phaffia rhodozyma]|uniref:WD40 repeat protein n=1 Tax=Phaffia rhodozyma TaxID=264483 RepID=A0A0F7SW20_PHARH|nr:WD40 repeat protein [Phaffia rhodozyma]
MVRQGIVWRESASIVDEGSNVSACFSWDSSIVFVTTSKSIILSYYIIQSPTPYSSLGTAVPRNSDEVFQCGAGESTDRLGWSLEWAGSCLISRKIQGIIPHQYHLDVAVLLPTPSICMIPYPIPAPLPAELKSVQLVFSREPTPGCTFSLTYSRALNTYFLVFENGDTWIAYRASGLDPDDFEVELEFVYVSLVEQSASLNSQEKPASESGPNMTKPNLDGGTVCALNATFCISAVGTESGLVHLFDLPLSASSPPVPHLASALSLQAATNNRRLHVGRVTSLAWSPDGYALAVGWERGWGIWSTGGKLLGWGVLDEDDRDRLATSDSHLRGVSNEGLLWVASGLELVILSKPVQSLETHPASSSKLGLLYVLSFAKSSFTSQPTPSSTKYPLLILSNKLLLSSTASLPSSTYLSSLTPSSSLWIPVNLPHSYINTQYPIKYATVSEDGRLIAVAGRRGLTHWSKSSGRWKLFDRPEWEESFRVRGGMAWFLHVLVAAIEEGKEFSIRLYSRDDALTPTSHLTSVNLPTPIHLMSLHDNSLLVYTTGNVLYHYLVYPTERSVELRLCGSMSFRGVVAAPGRVRALSWLVPSAQTKLGHPADDLPLATIILLINSSLVLLRPRKPSRHHRRTSSLMTVTPASEEVKYDSQVLADNIESYWTHLSGIGTLENSLWGWDGEQLRVWLDALTVDRVQAVAVVRAEAGAKEEKSYARVGESVSIPLDFYPLSVLMDKGIIIGLSSEASIRQSLSFANYKLQTSTHLFLPYLLRFHLSCGQVKAAVRFASFYQSLSYFAHALEILLHGVLEQEADDGPAASPQVVDGLEWQPSQLSPLSPIAPVFVGEHPPGLQSEYSPAFIQAKSPSTEDSKRMGVLPLVIDFLDHFPQALEVVVGCARKTEIDRWDFLFDVVGNPRDLFEKCLDANQLQTATSYLLVLHHLEQLADASIDTVRIIRAAMRVGEWNLCKDLLRFLHSADESGALLIKAIESLGLYASREDMDALISSSNFGLGSETPEHDDLGGHASVPISESSPPLQSPPLQSPQPSTTTVSVPRSARSLTTRAVSSTSPVRTVTSLPPSAERNHSSIGAPPSNAESRSDRRWI